MKRQSWLAIALLWLILAQAIRGAVISSLTSDEGAYLTAGYALLRTGDLRFQAALGAPPLLHVLTAATWLLDPALPDPRTVPAWDSDDFEEMKDAIVWTRHPPDALVLAGRVPIILLTVLLGALVYRWAADLAGWKAGLLALFLYALDPNIIAHGQLATTDMGVTAFGFAAMYFCFKSQASDSRLQGAWSACAGVCIGAAMASKVSAAVIAPLALSIVLLAGRGSLVRRLWHAATMGLIAFVTVWALYGFEIGYAPGIPVPLPAATHIKIGLFQQNHFGTGHRGFLKEMYSLHGWWYYFPVAFLIKTPLPTLILLAASLALSLSRWRSAWRHWQTYLLQWLTLSLFPIVHAVAAIASPLNIGYRYLLPILPFLCVFIGVQIASRRAQDASRIAFYVLLAWYSISAATIFPHHLAYFNELIGGPENGYRWLVDSNLDWGQNLKELKTWVDAHGLDQFYYGDYGPAHPEAYGLPAKMLWERTTPYRPLAPDPGWYVISATTLQGVYQRDRDALGYFRTLTPTARIGYALFIYYVPEESPGQWVAQCANPVPPLEFEDIRAGFGHARQLRLVSFDCSTSWWYPAQDAPGWYVNMPGAQLDVHTWLPAARLIFQSRSKPTFSGVYRVDRPALPSGKQEQARAAPSDWTPEQAMTQGTLMTVPAATTGPLQFEGFWREDHQRTVRRGGELVVYTAWRVVRPYSDGEGLPSIMAHLLDAQGRLVSNGDGLGVPVVAWQVGDVIVQAHRLAIPRDLATGTYWVQTGVYRLDTMDRYHFLQGEQLVGNRLVLAQVRVE